MSKVILISGGSDGLGKEIARKLAPNNRVVILAHNREKLSAAAEEVHCDFVEAELTDFNSLKEAVNQIISKYQRIDVLVNNAGVWIEGGLETNDPEKIKNVIDINTTGTIFLTKVVLPQLRTQKGGQIINIVSQDGLCAKKDRSVYHASKWAITGFTRCLQEDVAGENIKVTAIYPGLMKTGLFAKNQVDRDLSDALDPSEVASLIESVINLDQTAYIPEVSIKNIDQNMDDQTTPTIDLNIDPDLITPQGSTPQVATPPVSPLPATPAQPSPTNSGVIDITPGSVSPEPIKPVDTTPTAETTPNLPPIPDSSPVAETNPTTPVPNIPSEPVQESSSSSPDLTASLTPPSQPEPVSTSPLAEDPDLVKLTK